jgi:hypothetical protein
MPEPEPSPDAKIRLVARGVTMAIGGILCKRFDVPALDEPETEGLSMAIAQLAIVYDLGNMDPRTAAWLGMGMTVMGAAAPRIAIVQARAPKPRQVDELTPETRAPAPPPPAPAAETVRDAQQDKDARAFGGSA